MELFVCEAFLQYTLNEDLLKMNFPHIILCFILLEIFLYEAVEKILQQSDGMGFSGWTRRLTKKKNTKIKNN